MDITSYIFKPQTLFLLTLVFFTIVTTLLTLYTVSNAVRLRNVKITWKDGKLKGYPLFSTLFLSFCLVYFGAHAWFQDFAYIEYFLCYTWAGLNWFVSSFLMTKCYITDYGIVKNINDPSQTVPWSELSDYFVRKEKDGVHYSFIYRAPNFTTGLELSRLELTVPNAVYPSFEKMLKNKLGRRFDYSSASVASIYRQLNQ